MPEFIFQQRKAEVTIPNPLSRAALFSRQARSQERFAFHSTLSRSDWNRTSDNVRPRHVLYQAELRSENSTACYILIVAAISMTYEFMTTAGALRFVERGTALGLMVTLRRDAIVHVVTTTEDIQEVNQLAKILGGMAIA